MKRRQVDARAVLDPAKMDPDAEYVEKDHEATCSVCKAKFPSQTGFRTFTGKDGQTINYQCSEEHHAIAAGQDAPARSLDHVDQIAARLAAEAMDADREEGGELQHTPAEYLADAEKRAVDEVLTPGAEA